jgi:hypothetical protein
VTAQPLNPFSRLPGKENRALVAASARQKEMNHALYNSLRAIPQSRSLDPQRL